MQRPNIFKLAEVDLAILRTGAGWLQKARNLRSDLQGIVGEFGSKLWCVVVDRVVDRYGRGLCLFFVLSIEWGDAFLVD